MAHTQPTGYLLIVEDESEIRAVVRLLFEEEHYSVSEAGNGHDALTILRSTPHRHVVLTDINMPVMDGTTFLNTIYADPALVQRHAYCVMTARGATLPFTLARLMGMMTIRLIAKPFDIAHLLALVDAARAQLASS